MTKRQSHLLLFAVLSLIGAILIISVGFYFVGIKVHTLPAFPSPTTTKFTTSVSHTTYTTSSKTTSTSSTSSSTSKTTTSIIYNTNVILSVNPSNSGYAYIFSLYQNDSFYTFTNASTVMPLPSGAKVYTSPATLASLLGKWIFSNWTCSGTGCYSGNNPSTNFTINSNIIETADFIPANTYTADIYADTNPPGPLGAGSNAFIYGINALTNKIVGVVTLPAGARPSKMFVSPDGSTIYVTNSTDISITANSIFVINTLTGTLLTTFYPPRNYGPNDSYGYSGPVPGTSYVSYTPYTDISPNGQYIYGFTYPFEYHPWHYSKPNSTYWYDSFYVLNATTGNLVANVLPTLLYPTRSPNYSATGTWTFAVPTPDNKYVYLLGWTQTTRITYPYITRGPEAFVSIMSTSTMNIVKTFTLPNVSNRTYYCNTNFYTNCPPLAIPFFSAVSMAPNGAYLYIGLQNSDEIIQINISTQSITNIFKPTSNLDGHQYLDPYQFVTTSNSSNMYIWFNNFFAQRSGHTQPPNLDYVLNLKTPSFAYQNSLNLPTNSFNASYNIIHSNGTIRTIKWQVPLLHNSYIDPSNKYLFTPVSTFSWIINKSNVSRFVFTSAIYRTLLNSPYTTTSIVLAANVTTSIYALSNGRFVTFPYQNLANLSSLFINNGADLYIASQNLTEINTSTFNVIGTIVNPIQPGGVPGGIFTDVVSIHPSSSKHYYLCSTWPCNPGQ